MHEMKRIVVVNNVVSLVEKRPFSDSNFKIKVVDLVRDKC